MCIRDRLENVAKIGSIGDIFDFKRGLARNYLIVNIKALYASKENINDPYSEDCKASFENWIQDFDVDWQRDLPMMQFLMSRVVAELLFSVSDVGYNPVISHRTFVMFFSKPRHAEELLALSSALGLRPMFYGPNIELTQKDWWRQNIYLHELPDRL